MQDVIHETATVLKNTSFAVMAFALFMEAVIILRAIFKGRLVERETIREEALGEGNI
jgi:hypothetical protein